MTNTISIIGDGAMGTVLSKLLCNKGKTVRMWGHDPEQLKTLQQAGENTIFLPGCKFHPNLTFEPDDAKILEGADLLVSSVPCQFNRPVWGRLAQYYKQGVPIVSVAKGIEISTGLRPSEILHDVLQTNVPVAVLSGPTIADELAHELPATACIASDDETLAEELQHLFSCEWLRVYRNDDIVGVELAAACKNVIAIAAGIIDGMQLGDNAKAALLSRGLAEIGRLGDVLSAKSQTFAGLAGLGDLVTTCISPKGRNRSFGERIGKSMSVEEALGATKSVVEGVSTCKSVVELAKKCSVEMPITQAVHSVIFEQESARDVLTKLMTRKLKAE